MELLSTENGYMLLEWLGGLLALREYHSKAERQP